MLCGLKSDLVELRQVDKIDAAQFAKNKNMPYHEVSSKTNEGVNEMFLELV